MRKKILVTAALPYANGPLHFGHIAGVYLPADCYSRFERLQGNDVLFICGSDEYGVAITLSAELSKRTPKEHVDYFHEEIQNFFRQMDISFNHYSRTTSVFHAPLVKDFFLDLLEQKYIEKKESAQLYSEHDKRFLADRYVLGTCPKCHFEEARGDECIKCGASYEATDLLVPRSKMSGAPLTLRKTEHWFLRFDLFKEKLQNFLSERSWRSNVMHFAKQYIEDIHSRAITRDLEWGVPVPLKEASGKVFYVWFDAPIGYISATHEWAHTQGNPDAWKDFWFDPLTRYVQFLGKDNIPFHALFFPAMTMGQKQPYKLVDDLVASEFYMLEGRQFSKSEGWIIDLQDFFSRFHTDQIRYMLAATAPETGDSEFTWKDFQMHCNASLVGKFGNLINRVLVFVQNHSEGKVPNKHQLEEVDLRFLNDLKRVTEEIKQQYANHRLRRASQLIMELAHLGNAYFDMKTPWKDVKNISNRPFMETTLNCCLECIKALALCAYPIIPSTCNKIWHLLGFSTPLKSHQWDRVLEEELKPGVSLPKPYILFQKVEDEVIEAESVKLNAKHEKALEVKEPPFTPLKDVIGFEDFQKIDLRVGRILSAEKVAKSKKLLKLEVDIGLEKRTILSGISQHFQPEDLVGKKVIVVANLKPAKLMGIESEGMILAGSLENALELLTVDNLPAGSEVS